jgi:rhodanese-related sulfurtransferase
MPVSSYIPGMIKPWSAPGIAVILTVTAMLLPGPAYAQALSRTEKLEGKLRVAVLNATKNLKTPVIKAPELKAILEDTNLVLIDIRQPHEQAVSMLPHAITTAEFAARFRQGIPKEKRLVVYCTIGYRSGKYAEELAKQGIKADNLEGGVLAWSFIGGKFLAKDPNGNRIETNRIHVYDKEWNIVHPDYQAVLP